MASFSSPPAPSETCRQNVQRNLLHFGHRIGDSSRKPCRTGFLFSFCSFLARYVPFSRHQGGSRGSWRMTWPRCFCFCVVPRTKHCPSRSPSRMASGHPNRMQTKSFGQIRTGVWERTLGTRDPCIFDAGNIPVFYRLSASRIRVEMRAASRASDRIQPGPRTSRNLGRSNPFYVCHHKIHERANSNSRPISW